MTAFALRLQEFVKRTNQKADDLVRNVTIDVLTKLDERSPVGDPSYWKEPAPKNYQPGTFRGNWQVGINSAPMGETGRIDPTGQATLAMNILSVGGKLAGTRVFIVNNVPYARMIEDGWSRQAPEGLVGRTAIEFQQFVDAAVGQAA